MSHKPPVPDSAVSPFPLNEAQASTRQDAQRKLAAAAAPTQPPEGATGGSGVRIAVGAAIGSAAIAAALIYYNRSK